MKTKKFDKKLALNKKTIADLSNGEMGKIQGGNSGNSCPECQAYTESICLSQCTPGGAGC